MGKIEEIAMDLLGGVAGGSPSAHLMELRAYLPSNYIEDAAELIMDHPGRAFIMTAMWIPVPYTNPLPDGGNVETDGPPGAYFLGRGLQELGYQVTYIADKHGSHVFQGFPGVDDYVEAPITGWKESEEFCNNLLAEKKPSVVIATERMGVTRNRRYLNARLWDVSEYTAKLDFLMDNHPVTIGIGDNGNEMGMGNFAPYQEEIPHPKEEPTITRSAKPILGRSSDWGCYGLLAALSKLAKRDVLPTAKEVGDYIVAIVDKGVVTGSGRSAYEVDGRPIEHQAELLGRFRSLLKSEGIKTKE